MEEKKHLEQKELVRQYNQHVKRLLCDKTLLR